LYKLISLQPIVIGYYEQLAGVLMIQGESYIKNGDYKKAAEKFNVVLSLQDMIRVKGSKISKYAITLKHKPNMTVTPVIKEYTGQAERWLESMDISCIP